MHSFPPLRSSGSSPYRFLHHISTTYLANPKPPWSGSEEPLIRLHLLEMLDLISCFKEATHLACSLSLATTRTRQEHVPQPMDVAQQRRWSRRLIMQVFIFRPNMKYSLCLQCSSPPCVSRCSCFYTNHENSVVMYAVSTV